MLDDTMRVEPHRREFASLRSLCEDIVKQQSEIQKEVLKGAQPYWHSDLRLLVSRTIKFNVCVYKPLKL